MPRTAAAIVFCLLALPGGGCYPHQIRPATPDELRVVQEIESEIEEVSRKNKWKEGCAVASIIRKTREKGRIYIYSDKTHRSDGRVWDALVRNGFLYLHEHLFERPKEKPVTFDSYTVLMIYHEGVHLLQSAWERNFFPSRAEDSAIEQSFKFIRMYDKHKRLLEVPFSSGPTGRAHPNLPPRSSDASPD